MIRVCAKGVTTPGIDIYQGNLISDVNELKTHVSYAFLKAYEYHVDPKFTSRWSAMKTAGIIRGAYDFFHPGKDPIAQADAFLKIVGPLDAGDLPCALDWESTDGTPAKSDCNAVYTWLEYVERKTGKTPIIYTGPSFMTVLYQATKDLRFSRFPLWIANYGVSCPSVPDPFKDWLFWQGAAKPIPGMQAPTDADLFNGSLDDLRAFIRRSALIV